MFKFCGHQSCFDTTNKNTLPPNCLFQTDKGEKMVVVVEGVVYVCVLCACVRVCVCVHAFYPALKGCFTLKHFLGHFNVYTGFSVHHRETVSKLLDSIFRYFIFILIR